MNNYKPTILIAEDDSAISDLLSDLFSSRYHVILANDGEYALNYLEDEENDIDLLLLDIMMPKVNGYQVLSQIKTRILPILILSAKSDALDQIKGLSLGAWGYSTKPFNSDVILSQVQNLVRLGQIVVD